MEGRESVSSGSGGVEWRGRSVSSGGGGDGSGESYETSDTTTRLVCVYKGHVNKHAIRGAPFIDDICMGSCFFRAIFLPLFIPLVWWSFRRTVGLLYL